jgi:hypothetical protein
VPNGSRPVEIYPAPPASSGATNSTPSRHPRRHTIRAGRAPSSSESVKRSGNFPPSSWICAPPEEIFDTMPGDLRPTLSINHATRLSATLRIRRLSCIPLLSNTSPALLVAPALFLKSQKGLQKIPSNLTKDVLACRFSQLYAVHDGRPKPIRTPRLNSAILPRLRLANPSPIPSSYDQSPRSPQSLI